MTKLVCIRRSSATHRKVAPARYSVGKSAFVKWLALRDFWISQGEPFRGSFNATTIAKSHTPEKDFCMLYRMQGICIVDLEKFATQSITQEGLEFVAGLTDVEKEIQGTKYGGQAISPICNVAFFANEEPPAYLFHKKIYLLNVSDMTAPADSLRWEFPGQQRDGSNPSQKAREFLATEPASAHALLAAAMAEKLVVPAPDDGADSDATTAVASLSPAPPARPG